MAELHSKNRRGKKYFEIQFTLYGERRSLTVGFKKLTIANKCLDLVERLESEKLEGFIKSETKAVASKLFDIFPKFKDRIVKSGLAVMDAGRMTVSELFDSCLENSTGLCKDGSKNNYLNCWSRFRDNFGDVQISNICSGDVTDFESELVGDGLAKSTIGGHLRKIKMAFKYGVDKKWLTENPIVFDSKKYPSEKSKEIAALQNEILTTSYVEQVCQLNDHPEFELMIKLVRWSGVRICEALILRWKDIDFDNDQIHIRGKDTEHGGASRENLTKRWCPLFYEIKEELAQAKTLAPKEKFIFNNILRLKKKPEFCVLKYCEKRKKYETVVRGRFGTCSATRLKNLLIKNDMEVYPKPWHGLRDYRINEVSKLPGVTPAMLDAWFGNNEATRRRHYSALAVTDGDKTNVLKNSMAAKNPQTTSKNPQIVRSGSVRSGSQLSAERKNLWEMIEKLGINGVSQLVEYTRLDSNQ